MEQRAGAMLTIGRKNWHFSPPYWPRSRAVMASFEKKGAEAVYKKKGKFCALQFSLSLLVK